jgi:molybdopterin biosynthesis enzyme MoaB
MRLKGLEKTSKAVLSRAVVGIHGSALIVNLPGSTRAVRESLGIILDLLPHAIEMIHGGGH